MSVTIKDNSKAVQNAVQAAIDNSLERIGLQAEAFAKDLTPVVTGRLKNSITFAVNSRENAVYIGSNVEYAPYVELGTSKRKAEHMLEKAATEHTGTYLNIIADEFSKIK